MRILLTIVFLSTSLFSLAQDSLKIDSELAFELKGQHVIAALSDNFECYNCFFNQVTDNPFHHFAIYSGVSHRLTLANKYKIETGLFIEERSFSGGSNTVSNWFVFPKIKIEARDSIRLFNRLVALEIKGGDFWNEDVFDILRFYNIDYQALLARAEFGKFSLGIFTIGDLSRNIGLDLHELYRFSLGYSNKDFENIFSVSINQLLDDNRGNHLVPSDINLSNHIRFKLPSSVELLGQLEARINEINKTSFAIGIQGKYASNSIDIRSSLRYYQSDFNRGYFSNVPQYATLTSYVGEQLYPLKNYYRDYSQWAAYSELQGRDVVAFELSLNYEKLIYKQLSFFGNLDLNIYGDIETGTGRTFPIYNSGIKINFLKQFSSSISLTNKHMNLFESFQTFYASRVPFLSYGVQLNLDRIPLRTRYFKNNG